MTNIDEKNETKYIQDVLNADVALSKALNKLSQSTLEKLRISLIDLIGDDLGHDNEADNIPIYVLDKVPGKKQASVIKRLYEDIDLDEDVMGSDNVSMVIDAAINSYKSSNSAAITAAVFLIMVYHMQESNRIMQRAGKSDQIMAINHLIGKGGQFENDKSIKGLYQKFDNATDDNGNTVPEINYTSTFNAASGIANSVKGKLRMGVTSDQFTAFLTAGVIQLAIISKNDKTAREYKVKNGNNPTGWLSRLDSDNIRTYRTLTAMCHSRLKKNIADLYKIKEATIINEMDPCKICIDNINRIFSVDDAISRVPRHYNCRCEVRLINNGDEIIDDDDDVDVD